jgi:hypothetical protein
MGARLIAIGAAKGELRLNAGRTSIGTAADNTCVIAHQTVSRRHATIELRGDTCLLVDTGSSNGTFVNGRRIVGVATVHSGDQLRFGGAAYLLLTDAAEAARTSGSIARRISVRTTIILVAILMAGAFATTLFMIDFERSEKSSAGLGSRSDTVPAASVSSALGAASSVATLGAAAASTSGASPIEQSTSADWLFALNQYRKTVGLAAVADNPQFTPGCKLHSRYVVKNYGNVIAGRKAIGAAIHSEDPAKPGFTKEGLTAARDGAVDEMFDPSGNAEPAWAIVDWMRGPFHRFSLLAPHLRSVGYGDYCEKGFCIATMNVRSDVDDSPSGVGVLASPIVYPPDGGVIDQTAFNGEWPDPLTSCPGYAPPAGYAITLELGSIDVPEISSYSLTFNGKPPQKLDTCLITPDNYTNPDANAQTVTRGILRHYGAIVLVPRLPLETGTYDVALTAGGHTYSWSFSVKP